VLSPLAWPLAYRFPVHRLSPDYTPGTAPETPTFLVVYRDRGDRVGFLEINPVTARLLERLAAPDAEATGRVLLTRIATELGHPDPRVVIDGGADILEALRRRDVILGTR
jgi:hypothetical protein